MLSVNCAKFSKFIEYVFVDEYFYLEAIADADGKVLYFAVTIRDKSFNPTFKNQVFQVTLGISKYSDIPGKPRSAQGVMEQIGLLTMKQSILEGRELTKTSDLGLIAQDILL